MNTNISANGLRQWAAQCETRAKDPLTTGPEYERLMARRPEAAGYSRELIATRRRPLNEIGETVLRCSAPAQIVTNS
jgi:hypothetical protein